MARYVIVEETESVSFAKFDPALGRVMSMYGLQMQAFYCRVGPGR